MNETKYISVWHVSWYDSFEEMPCVECFDTYEDAVEFMKVNGLDEPSEFATVSGPHPQRVA
jgi:hypothetical protein